MKMGRIFVLHVLFVVLLTASGFANGLTVRAPAPALAPAIVKLQAINNVCTKTGLLCETCTSLVNCVQQRDNKFEKIPVTTCKTGTSCNLNKCSSEPNSQCSPDVPFVCTATGLFPDPYDCHRYHSCLLAKDIVDDGNNGPTDIKTELKCPADYGYDPVAMCCKVPLRDGLCPANVLPVPVCRADGQTGALSNPTIYYICGTDSDGYIRAKLYLCPNGGRYANSRCT